MYAKETLELTRPNAFFHSSTMERDFLSALLSRKAFRGAQLRMMSMVIWKCGLIASVRVSSLGNRKQYILFN